MLFKSNVALTLKGIKFEYVENLANKSEILLKYIPVHKPICESLVILVYIEETWKENAILPKDRHGKVRAHRTIRFLDISFGWLAQVVDILEEIIELKMIDKETFSSLSAWTKTFTNSLTIKDSFSL
ncbi:Glutathione transferase protein [Dioscorea alata]|uniref:Glutathione transferase protein n=1 Tax=Dioscorea alata TaxID=55571 RepID=A0ACB7V2I3_DIOAL|nr:Glutathione transferase protein [Dioscorea alata]